MKDRTMHRIQSLWLACALVLPSACTSTPAPRLHSLLAPQPPALMPAEKHSQPTLWLDLSPVTVPAAVEQPQWLVRLPDNTLRLLEQERWASALRDEIRTALRSELSQRFGAQDARLAATAGAWHVHVEVLRFELVPGVEAWLSAQWRATNSSPGVPPISCAGQWHEAASAELVSLASAQRRAVVRLAEQIGQQLRGLDGGCNSALPVVGATSPPGMSASSRSGKLT
jgi:uncharacterized protein